MKVMFITGEQKSDTCLEMIRQLGYGSLGHYVYSDGSFKNNKDFDNDQKYFDCIYSPNPEILLRLKPKIPYFYDIPSGTFDFDLNFKVFNQHYSQLGGAKAVFVSDKKMSRYAAWEELNPFWVNEGIDFEKQECVPKKFFTPKLHIGFINDSEEDYKIIKDVLCAKKPNWEFHIYNSGNIEQDGSIKFYEGNPQLAKKMIYENSHLIINPSIPCNNSLRPFPLEIALESMYNGCVNISGNIHDNADNVLFDNFHYFKLDFIDANTVIETLRYADKRRDKLERMAVSSKEVVKKYFNAKESARNKLDVIHKLI